jgi:hypothetical protein
MLGEMYQFGQGRVGEGGCPCLRRRHRDLFGAARFGDPNKQILLGDACLQQTSIGRQPVEVRDDKPGDHALTQSV